jgi:hypothetical protein
MANIDRLADVKEKLKQADYLVSCSKGKNSCILSIPESIECHQISYEYKVTRGTTVNIKVLADIPKGIEEQHDKIKVPKYSVVAVIFSDIIAKCNAIGYCVGVISFMDNEINITEQELFSTFTTKLSAEDTIKSDILTNLITQSIIENLIFEELAKTYDIYEGYMVCVRILGLLPQN